MVQGLKRVVSGVYWIDDDGKRREGCHDSLRGDVGGLYGYRGGLRGDASGLYGDASGLRGDVDQCGLTDDDREAGVDIASIVAE